MTEPSSDLGKFAESLWLGVRKSRLGQGGFHSDSGQWVTGTAGTGPEGKTWRLVDV